MDYSVKSKDIGSIIIELKVTNPLTIEISSECLQEFTKTIETFFKERLKGGVNEMGDEKLLPPKNSYILEDEAAKITGFSVQTLRNYRFKRIGFPYYKIGRSVRYKVKDILDYMEKFKIQTMR